MKHYLVPALFVLIIILLVLYFNEKLSYPVTYKVCGVGYVDCHNVAKFKDRLSCETTNQKWGWYCDQTDKSNILCREEDSDISDGYCN